MPGLECRVKEDKFQLTTMGVLAPGSSHARPSARPPSTLAEIFRRTCLGGKLSDSFSDQLSRQIREF